jgi:hypothetical protein
MLLWRIIVVNKNVFIKVGTIHFTVMAPVSQLICVSYMEKSTNTFGPKNAPDLLDE